MEVHFTPEQDGARFREGVKRGIAAAERGEFVELEEVWANAEKILQILASPGTSGAIIPPRWRRPSMTAPKASSTPRIADASGNRPERASWCFLR
jgi:hypothetical protein